MKAFWGLVTVIIIGGFLAFLGWLVFYGGAEQLVCGNSPCPTQSPYPTVTPHPDAQLLDCQVVQIDGEHFTMRLCKMPDGMTCLFEGDKPTTCYPSLGGSR